MKQYLSTKKSQIWGYDLMAAIIIFLIGIISIYVYSINFSSSEDKTSSFFYQGNLASSIILSEGIPENWNAGNYETPGILTNQKINQTKLDNFYQLSENDYQSLKKALNLQYDFFFILPSLEVLGNPVDGIGSQPASPKDIVKIDRFTIYKNKPVKFTIYVWD